MGGLGSGRQGSGRATVESLRKLDLKDLDHLELRNVGDQKALGWPLVELRRSGLLIRYFGSDDYAEEFVGFVYTRTQFGGRRRWLSCPRCNRRVRVLYQARRFRCRKCLGLVYESTRQPWYQRVIDQADKLSFRVTGAAAAVYERDDFPDKPKRMRWAIYWKLEERYYRYMSAWAVGFAKKFGMGP
jgi:hypothetical protein